MTFPWLEIIKVELDWNKVAGRIGQNRISGRTLPLVLLWSNYSHSEVLHGGGHCVPLPPISCNNLAGCWYLHVSCPHTVPLSWRAYSAYLFHQERTAAGLYQRVASSVLKWIHCQSCKNCQGRRQLFSEGRAPSGAKRQMKLFVLRVRWREAGVRLRPGWGPAGVRLVSGWGPAGVRLGSGPKPPEHFLAFFCVFEKGFQKTHKFCKISKMHCETTKWY